MKSNTVTKASAAFYPSAKNKDAPIQLLTFLHPPIRPATSKPRTCTTSATLKAYDFT